MRERTHSLTTRVPVAHLPSTSTLATAVLTVAWWLTMVGLTTPTLPHIGVAATAAAVVAAFVVVAAQPQVRSVLSRWVFRLVAHGRHVLPPDVAERWTRAHHTVRPPASHELELVRVARPRAPGQGFVTA